MLDTWLQDVRYAVRLLRRNLIFTATAAASLAIGIAATTTIFTIANALLIVPEGQFETPAGATLRALLLDDPVHSAEPGF